LDPHRKVGEPEIGESGRKTGREEGERKDMKGARKGGEENRG